MKDLEIKICGITNVDDARLALDAGADYIGFVLYPPSPRGVSVAAMKDILEALDTPARAVGVFVNQPRQAVLDVAKACGLAAVQIHGDEVAADFADMPVTTWRAVKIVDGVTLPDPGAWAAERYVVDTAVPGMYGGTGVAADWDRAAELAAGCPVMLAGGLTPDNVARAVNTVRPRGVDVASGVERQPGRKDPEAVRAFVAAAREARNGTD